MSNSAILTAIQNGVQAINALIKQVQSLPIGDQITSLSARIATTAASSTVTALSSQVTALSAQVTSLSSQVPDGFFSVYMSSDQLTGGTTVVVRYANENFDTKNWFDTTTFKFQPTESGYYYLYNQVYGTDGTEAYIYKDGNIISYGSWAANTLAQVSVMSQLVFMNGSSNYIEFGGYASSTIYSTIPGSIAFGYKLGTT